MNPFHPDGHLTDEALHLLVTQADLEELTRLELSEHLAYCDQCLQRYTALLCGDVLEAPAHPCRESLWKRIHRRAVHLFLSRYATAAAAVAVALSLVWGGIRLPERPALPSHSWPSWSEVLHPHFDSTHTAQISKALSNLWNSGSAPQIDRGGHHV